jgi:PAS domain S-box-containing protein
MKGVAKVDWGRHLAWAGLIGVLYFLLARLSLNFVVQPEGIAIIWPANGFLLAVLLLSQRRRWLGLLGAACLANFAANVSVNNGPVLSLGLAVINCIEAGLAAWLMDRFFERPISLNRLKEMIGLLGLGVVLSSAFAASLGAALVYFSSGAPFLTTWLVWWVADGMGILVVTPILLTWAARISSHKPLTWSRMIEGGLLLGLLTVMTVGVFRSSSEIGLFIRPSYITLPFLVWAAVRFGPRGTAIASLILAGISIWYTMQGIGPFASITSSALEEALGLQLFLSITTFSYLALAAVIAEHRQAEEQLHFQKTVLECQSEAAIDGIIVVSGDKRWLSFNRRFVEMWGLPEGIVKTGLSTEALAHSMEQVVDPGAFMDRINYFYEHPDLADWDEVTLKDGRIFDRYTAPVKSSDGIYYGRVWYYRDITARKEAEKRQAQLLQDLESANQELNDFAYIVSHDLKAPLRAIGLLADWIATDYASRLGTDGQRQLNLLISRVRRMHMLIDGILEYSRVGRTREKESEVDLNSLVAEAIDLIAPPPHIVVSVESQLPRVIGERTRLQQLFQNLVGNAVKFMDKPQGEIKIGCIEQDGNWQFYVADNGPGIEAKYFGKIFQLFQILIPRDEVESTGVGLALVKKIVELYGGKVWVESEVGRGTTFFFTLPTAGFYDTIK